MKIITDIKGMKSFSSKMREEGKSIGFVPTMGALHEGHVSLIRKARDGNECVIISIFVNPAQFDRKDDFLSYPVDRANDHELALKNGVDIVFEPEVDDMYPDGFETYIDQKRLPNRLCGLNRPGHFRGVSTVVTKLFNIVKPHKAYFGEKDLQQSAIIRRLVKDLNMDVEIVVLPTVRSAEGAACSSRNRLLSAEERLDALSLYDALNNAQSLIKSGVRDSREIIGSVIKIINSKKNVKKIDYVSIVNQDTLEDSLTINGQEIIAMAVWIGNTRLIDNCRLTNND